LRSWSQRTGEGAACRGVFGTRGRAARFVPLGVTVGSLATSTLSAVVAREHDMLRRGATAFEPAPRSEKRSGRPDPQPLAPLQDTQEA
jgi:hypothetical protein